MGNRSAVLSAAAIAVGLFAIATPAGAQERFASQCAALATADVRNYCARVGEAAEVAQARIGMAFTGGNPVPGSGSTLGRRLRKIPRVSVDARATTIGADLPPTSRIGSDTEVDARVTTFNVDAAVGVVNGFSLLPTVGGFASVDLLASYGFSSLPDDKGFDDSPNSWGLGARVGLLRESFTVPGVSVSAMYRGFGDVDFGDRTLTNRDAAFRLSDQSVFSLRGTVGKRFLTLGATAGVGYDRYSSEVAAILRDPAGGDPLRVSDPDFDSDRTTVFGNVSWSMLIVHLVGEVGWQSGGDVFPAPTGFESQADQKAWYGSLAVRVAI